MAVEVIYNRLNVSVKWLPYLPCYLNEEGWREQKTT